MKNGKQHVTFFAAIIVSLAFLPSLGLADQAGAGLSAQDEDAFVLYEYSLKDAKRNRSSKITHNTDGETTTYEYDGHALSCRTVMRGSITETTSDHRTRVVGDFDVSNNSYGITQLSFDFYDEGRRTRTGTMTINDKVIDIKHFDHQ